jgi:uncharacterized protein YegL
MALTLRCVVDRARLSPRAKAKCFLAVEVVAAGARREETRPAARTVLAIDTSMSMKGEPLDQVIRSVDRLLDALTGGESTADEIGIVAFSQNATRVVEPVRVDPGGKRLVRSRVSRLQPLAATNIEGGLDLAAAMLADTPAGMRRGVVLLSDGAPNVGAHTAEGLQEVVRRHRPGISFFALGYGADHSEQVLSAIGEAGGGGYEFIADPASCARSFARALGAQGDVVAAGIELVLGLPEGVELVRLVGRESMRFSRDGVVIALPDMVDGARRVVVAELDVRAPGPDRFAVKVATATLRWNEGHGAASASARASTEDATVEVGEEGGLGANAIVPEAARLVLLVRADEVRDAARELADRGQFSAAAVLVRRLMSEIERLPGWVANDGSPLAEAYELLVDEAMAFERRPSAEAYAQFKKATAGSRVAASVPSSARLRGDASQHLIEQIAGDRPEAWLVDLRDGARHELAEECVIGRTSQAQIQVASSSVSRKHAEVFANAGDYWVADLGSTNPTLVNGKALGSVPHKLLQGDVVQVGDVELRYEQRE